MNAIGICEYDCTGTLKLEQASGSSIDRCWFEVAVTAENPADWKGRHGYLKQLCCQQCDKQVRK